MSLLAAAGLATNQPPASLDPVAALSLQPITVGLPSPRLRHKRCFSLVFLVLFLVFLVRLLPSLDAFVGRPHCHRDRNHA